MIAYLARRLLQVVPVLFGISVVVFLLVRLISGDPAVAALGSRATPQLIARVRDQLGLDLPLWQQYLNFLGNALRGEFGISFFYQAEVWSIVAPRLPIILLLMVIAVVIATPSALLAAIYRGRAADHAVRVGFTAALGMPVFWSAIVLAFFFGVRWRLLPIAGPGDDPGAASLLAEYDRRQRGDVFLRTNAVDALGESGHSIQGTSAAGTRWNACSSQPHGPFPSGHCSGKRSPNEPSPIRVWIKL